MLTSTERWFAECLEALPHSEELKAYVAGVLNKFVTSSIDDMSKLSIVIAFAEANGDFVKLQKLGDWVLWTSSFAPTSMSSNVVIIQTMGQRAYDACFRLLRRQWRVYEELADELPHVARQVHQTLQKRSILP